MSHNSDEAEERDTMLKGINSKGRSWASLNIEDSSSSSKISKNSLVTFNVFSPRVMLGATTAVSILLGVGIVIGKGLYGPSSSSPSPSPSPSPLPPSGHAAYDPFEHHSNPFTSPPPFRHQASPLSSKAYAMQPTIYNHTVVFVSEGDLFVAPLPKSKAEHNSASFPILSSRLTTGLGNELTPQLSPDGSLVAFTATYDSSSRQAYILPLSGQFPATRLTYIDHGVRSIAGWSPDGSSILVSAASLDSTLPDPRLYKVVVRQRPDSDSVIGGVEAVPISQSTEGLHVADCLYFTRFKQSSSTNRYVGGTAESLWAHCDGKGTAVKITSDYRGTSRSPRVYVSKSSGDKYLFFISDRTITASGEPSSPGLLNLFAIYLPTKTELYGVSPFHRTSIRITNRCSSHIGISEFSIDPVSNNIVLRSGADLEILFAEDVEHILSGSNTTTSLHPSPLNLALLSDFSQTQERIIRVDSIRRLLTAADAHVTLFSTKQVNALLTIRGQVFVAPLLPSSSSSSPPSSPPLPLRRFRLTPGYRTGGAARALSAKYLNATHALVLATDYASERGAEHAFFVARADGAGESGPLFAELDGGEADRRLKNSKAGSSKDGGLGSVLAESLQVSENGKYAAWFDTDGRLCGVRIETGGFFCVKTWIREFIELTFSPSGRYLAFTHLARNQFSQISILDLNDVELRVRHATVDRFNCRSPYWGRSESGALITLFYLSDRDIRSEPDGSPWGSRAPMPKFENAWSLFGIPIKNPGQGSEDQMFDVAVGELNAQVLGADEGSAAGGATSPSNDSIEEQKSIDWDFYASDSSDSSQELAFARLAYMVSALPPDDYGSIISQSLDKSFLSILRNDGRLLLLLSGSNNELIELEGSSFDTCRIATDGAHILCTQSVGPEVVAFSNANLEAILAPGAARPVFTDDLSLSVFPKLEYVSMYSDAWRMLRDYFYDKEMHGLGWEQIYDKYLPLVTRANQREELDDVFKLMAGELSALHVFVYGGEYRQVSDDPLFVAANAVGSLGGRISKTKSGYIIDEVFLSDPDFPVVEGRLQLSPISHAAMSRSMQRGLVEGDTITSVNGENPLALPDLNFALRGMSGKSIRLGITRKGSGLAENVVVSVLSAEEADNLRYSSWEYRTRTSALKLAKESGFNIGYVHLRSMSGSGDEDSFTRSFFSDYDKDGFIIDVRHNRGGNIDSWILEVLQRRAWMFWGGRNSNITNGGLGWDEQFAFRGEIIVLIDENTASDGEAFARGVKTLGLGKLVGTRTWGGGIWLSSDNRLVDGGLGGSAPEVGTYNDEFGWGLGVENMGVDPDVAVDNDPREAFDKYDRQLTVGVEELVKLMHEKQGSKLPRNPGKHKSVKLDDGVC